MALEFWHNPRCSKSRAALALLEERGVALNLRRYLDTPPDQEELRALAAKLGRPVIEMVRVKEAGFKAAGLTRESGEDALFAAMAADPKLIERPVLIGQERAAIGRPPEAVLALIEDD
ncbi:arsenate reductase (glutaredoxin) [Roseivivax sp. GX 12232]|uniref:arsenate reductase (glutaredoxin) n=1 Tax=Roseivivax sp. GX 12232 TaxID=2900547 RepID=UPI001E5DF3A1|nr:arsenate reductase (glutaredoxin) [Roseivivax sp. GX 12232]MCE0505171.1 arsenate reductase (glutaredoxin) [Roseivivax sp. GX 12232]